MVHEITRSGLIVAQTMRATDLVEELVAVCDWPLLLQPAPRVLFQHVDRFQPACLLFWLEADGDAAPTTRLITLLRDRGARPYRLAVAHSLAASFEHTFRTAGVHSYFAVNGNLRALVDEAILPIVERQRVVQPTALSHERGIPAAIRGPTESRASPASRRPP